jgi:hypothetical protein
MKAIFIPKKHQVITLADKLSEKEHDERMDRITNAIRKRKDNYFKEPTYSIVDMVGSREDDAAVDLLKSNLTSLGMPALASTPEIPPLPSADDIAAASRATDEVQKWIKAARIYAGIDEEEK